MSQAVLLIMVANDVCRLRASATIRLPKRHQISFPTEG